MNKNKNDKVDENHSVWMNRVVMKLQNRLNFNWSNVSQTGCTLVSSPKTSLDSLTNHQKVFRSKSIAFQDNPGFTLNTPPPPKKNKKKLTSPPRFNGEQFDPRTLTCSHRNWAIIIIYPSCRFLCFQAIFVFGEKMFFFYIFSNWTSSDEAALEIPLYVLC